LLVNVITALIASYVIKQFDETIGRMAILATFMPIIAGVAGNGATQTLAVTIRRISTDGIPARKAVPVIFKELSVGLINGLLIGSIVSIVAYATYNMPLLGLVVFLAMAGNLLLAGLMGSFTPIALEKLGVDPAVASSIFITAFTDVIGYTLLFGLATQILMH
jgi:magnesium transporter